MRALTIILGVSLISSVVLAEPQIHWHDDGTEYYTDDDASPKPILVVLDQMMIGVNPAKKGDAYTLAGAIPFQRVEGGYLITESPEYLSGPDMYEPIPGLRLPMAFLKTKRVFQRGQLLDGTIKCVGTHAYETVDGFGSTVPAFEFVQ